MEYENLEEDSAWTQNRVIHCPNKDCKGMLLENEYSYFLKCSDCGKMFTYSMKYLEIKNTVD